MDLTEVGILSHITPRNAVVDEPHQWTQSRNLCACITRRIELNNAFLDDQGISSSPFSAPHHSLHTDPAQEGLLKFHHGTKLSLLFCTPSFSATVAEMTKITC